jgi:hypothetical protein
VKREVLWNDEMDKPSSNSGSTAEPTHTSASLQHPQKNSSWIIGCAKVVSKPEIPWCLSRFITLPDAVTEIIGPSRSWTACSITAAMRAYAMRRVRMRSARG